MAPPATVAPAGASGQVAMGSAGEPGAPGASGAGAGGSNAAPVAAGSGSAGNAAPTTPVKPGSCCANGNCLCRGAAPTALSSDAGPLGVEHYALPGAGCLYYPKDAEPPFAAVAMADGFGGSGGCASVQTGQWGTLYASHGIVTLIVETGSGAQPASRGHALNRGIAALKAEHEKTGSPLFGKLAGRYGTAGFSMGGGGTTYATRADASLLSNVAIMPWGAADGGGSVPTLIICGSTDGVAPCKTHGAPAYAKLGAAVPKLRVEVAGGHNGQPGTGSASPAAYALAFQKVFLDGDERWRPLLVAAPSVETTIR